VIPYGRQSISAADIQAVVETLQSDFLTQGPAVPRFEAKFAAMCGAPHAVAMNSATSALHLACVALGLGPGDVLWTSPNTFVASANCARYCGADVDFVDVEPGTGNLDVAALARKLEGAPRKPKIVVPVAFAGLPCDLKAIHALSRRHGFKVVEDASHAVGARHDGAPCGDGRWSDVSVFSFHPVKIITTGEGGLATTRDAALAETLRELRSHGITREPARMTGPPPGAWYYEQRSLGWNFRMTDLQAALGASQLDRLPAFLARRRALVQRYDARLRELPLLLPERRSHADSAWHLYVVRLDPARTPRRRDEVFAALRAAGVGVNVHYIPVHTQPYYRALGFAAGQFPEAERHYAQALSLPLYADLTDAQQDTVIDTLARTLAPAH